MDSHPRVFFFKPLFRSIYCRKMPNILSKLHGKFEVKERSIGREVVKSTR